ncbi:M20/M25/M40 family metallo-hydrolase [Acidicapsa acidisoli]|uniref:M20/M25/M40 family metallo-hydrolase n=1 Tax=Acidicapsa acidisoli TaxID=1615681 RepID=UPI0021DF8766|nr:M20/M25/M40 family metallo-hydrolase [Acidicapsa acidisoli]
MVTIRNFSCHIRFIACAVALGPAILAAQMPQSAPASAPAPTSLRDRVMARILNSGPSAWTPAQIANMARLRDAAIADPYALDELRHLSDNIGPRISGSPQAQQAVEYVAAEMRSLGADVTLEKTSVPHWIRGIETGSLVDWKGMTPGTTQKIVLTALGGSVATPADGITAEVVVVNSWADLKALSDGPAATSLKGKIILFNKKFDKQLAAQEGGIYAYGDAVQYRAAAPIAGASVGAAAVLVRSVGGADYRIPHTGMTMYTDGIQKIPAAAVTAEDADLLADLASQGPVKLHLTLTPQTLPDAPSYNVIADWKGAEHPEQVVIVSGHLDSWDLGTGAIDDGAGVVVSMQAIHLLSRLGIHPKRTVRFIAWMSEEEGSQGAATYIKEHAAEAANHIGAIESDLGAGHPDGVLFAGKPALEDWLRPVAQALEPIGANTFRSSPETGEDINVLTEKGVPSFAPSQDGRFYFNYHHTPADTFDKVNPRELSENAAVMTVLAYALADSAEPAPR